jgi:hypothetical protein
MNDNIRISILKQGRRLIKERQGFTSKAFLSDTDRLVRALDNAIDLLSLNLREKVSPKKISKEELIQDPFSHNSKFKGLYQKTKHL